MPKRNSYTNSFKIKAANLAQQLGSLRKASNQLGIHHSMIDRWCKETANLEQMPKNKRANRGKLPKFPQIEEKVLEFVQEKQKKGFPVSTTAVRLHAKILAKEQGIQDFKASPHWCYLFMKRNNISIRRKTHIAQKLPSDFEEKLINFQKFIIRQRKMHKFSLDLIINADQTPLTFDLLPNSTLETTGSKTVNVITTGSDKLHFTVMLACTANGGKLPPYVVFKRKTMPKDKFPKGIIVTVQEKGWFDDNIMKDWIKRSFSHRIGALRRQKSMLVLDAFRCHKSKTIKELLKDENCVLAVIPGGMTGLLQPLDVCINKPFKNHLRELWAEWISSNDHTFTPSGSMRKASMVQVCEWILIAWDKIPQDLITKAFKKCCISNELDGSEDDAIFNDFCVNLNDLRLEDSDSEMSDIDCDNDLFYADDVPLDLEPIIVEIL